MPRLTELTGSGLFRDAASGPGGALPVRVARQPLGAEFNRGPAGDGMLMRYVPGTGLARVVQSSAPLAGR